MLFFDSFFEFRGHELTHGEIERDSRVDFSDLKWFVDLFGFFLLGQLRVVLVELLLECLFRDVGGYPFDDDCEIGSRNGLAVDQYLIILLQVLDDGEHADPDDHDSEP